MGNTNSTHLEISAEEKPTIQKKTNNRKPQPFVGSFYDTQHVTPKNLHLHKPNRNPGSFNYFEIAAATTQPITAKSIHSNTTSSSIKSSSKKSSTSYPSKLQTSLKSNQSSIDSSTFITTPEEKGRTGGGDPNYIEMHGRTYWKGNRSQKFLLPCDDDESDRLMTMHYILKSAFHGNFISPVQSLFESGTKQAKVLDIGCGSGTWILEMATEFPNTDFYGVDDCPLFPTSIKPSNAHFKLHDILKGLPFKENQFDFVYMRSMILYFTPDELSHLLTEISRVMKPGAYFEVVDTNYTIQNPGPLSTKLVNTEIKNVLHQSSSISPSTYESNTNHPIFTFLMLAPQKQHQSFMISFTDICQEHTALGLGGWDTRQISDLHSLNFRHLLCSLSSLDHPILPLSKDLIESIFDECDQYSSYLDWFACYARKPLNDDQLEQSTLDSIYEFVEGFVDV